MCLRLHYKWFNGYIFVNGVDIYKINTEDSQINAAALCLSNIPKHFPADIKKKTGLCF